VSPAGEPIELEVGSDHAGERLDRFLTLRLDWPRNQCQAWLREGRVTVDGRRVRASHKVASGERVRCTPPVVSGDARVEPEAGVLSVLYEDDWLVALDKPSGLAVHPGAGRTTGTLAHRLLARYPEMAGVGGPGRPGIVHRLDLGTSGVMVVVRRAEAYQRLTEAFATRRVEKLYLAWVLGVPKLASQRIEAPIGRHALHRKEMTVRADGRPAATTFHLLGTAGGISLLALELHTGRTHQIRVHMKSVGLPLVGDPVYGEARWKGLAGPAQRLARDFPRPALHAWRLALPHPEDGRRLELEAPLPADLEELWRGLGGAELAGLLAPIPR
jgi:23S rRNA pseudouridine1911/1915/1917 synthase